MGLVKVFESENIYYVKVSLDLIHDYLKLINDINVRNCISHKEFSPVSYEDEVKWVQSNLSEDSKCYSMIEKGTDLFIGNIEIMNIHDDVGELGIAITSDKQDKHYGTEGIKAMIDYANKVLGLRNIELNVFSNNERARHCYKGVGFVEDGIGKTEDDIHMVYRRR